MINEFYDFTVGGAVKVAVELLDLIACGVNGGGFTANGLRAFLAYVGPGGGIQTVICRVINFFGKIITLLRMVFSGPFVTLPLLNQDIDQVGVLNYIWCKLVDWFPFFEVIIDIVEFLEGVVDGILCIIDKLVLFFGNFGDCFLSVWRFNAVCPGADFFARLANIGCDCSIGIFNLNIGSCYSKSLKRVDIGNQTNWTIHGDCEGYENTTLGLEHQADCIWSNTVAAGVDILLLNDDFPQTRLIPPKSFYSLRELGNLLYRITLAMPDIWGEISEFIFSDADPYDATIANCSSVFDKFDPDKALEHRLCLFAVGFARSLREMGARGEDTLLGAIVNVIGEIIHLSKPFDLEEHLVSKSIHSIKYSQSWQDRLAFLDARRAITEIKLEAPPLLKKKVAERDLERVLKSPWWAKDEVLKMYGVDKAGPARELPWRPVFNHFSVALERKREEVIPGYKEKKLHQKALVAPNFSLPSDLLCPSVGGPGLNDPDNILDLRCTQRKPMWDAYGNIISVCEADLQPFWEIPTCTTNYSAPSAGAHCCGFAGCTATSCPLGDAGDCAPTNCDPRIRVYGNCTSDQCERVLNSTALSLVGACCTEQNTGCSLETNETCAFLLGTFAGVGTTCADFDLPLACESCRQTSCRRCDFVLNFIDEFIDLVVEIGVDYFNLFEGAIVETPKANFTDSALPEAGEREIPFDPMLEFVTGTFEFVYNWFIRGFNSILGTNFQLVDGSEYLSKAHKFFATKEENSLHEWWHTLRRCDVHTAVSLTRGKRGTGIKVAVVFVTLLYALGIYLWERFVKQVPITKVAGALIFASWLLFVLAIAFAISPFCFIKLAPPFIGGPSLFYVIPLPNLPIIPHGAVIHLTEELLEPLQQPCFDDCKVACPFPSAECWPCAWEQFDANMTPGDNCNASITHCCENCQCPTKKYNYERRYPQCARAPFNITGANREALLYLRKTFPAFFCILKRSAGFALTDPQDWEFSDNDCTWKNETEALQFITDDPRWEWCFSRPSNLGLLGPYFVIGLIGFLLVLPLLYSLLWLISALLDRFSYWLARLVHGMSLIFGLRARESIATWIKRYEVDGSWMKRPKIKNA
jgi:hypothetical protein